MGNSSSLSLRIILILLLSTASLHAQESLAPDTEQRSKELALDLANNLMPAGLELYYLENTDGDGHGMAVRYDWHTASDWAENFTASGTDFSGSKSNVFARGNYVFDGDANPSELSEVGASWTRRWFPITVTNPLNPDQASRVQNCLASSTDFDVTAEECQRRLGLPQPGLSYWYADFDVHAKMEGDQSFDQRNYVFGFQTRLSRSLGNQRLFLYPILTIGIEQVDPKGNEARLAVLASEDAYSRAYGELGFTSVLATIGEQNIKLNFSVRHFQELSPEDVIDAAGLDTFTYTVVALQVPAAVFPGFDNTRNSFVLSYADGKLPFNVTSETTFELGFRHDIDFDEFF